MEDDTKANSVQQYGVTLQVLATKKGPMEKLEEKPLKTMQLTQNQLAHEKRYQLQIMYRQKSAKKQVMLL